MNASHLGTPINGGNDFVGNQSIVDFRSVIHQANMSKAALSPLRSLDFGAINNASFTLMPNKSLHIMRQSQNKKKDRDQKQTKIGAFGKLNSRRASSKSGRSSNSLINNSPKRARQRTNSVNVNPLAKSVINRHDYNSVPMQKEESIAEVNEEMYKETLDSMIPKQNDDIEDMIIGIQRKQAKPKVAPTNHQDICQVNFYHSVKESDSEDLSKQYQRFSEL